MRKQGKPINAINPNKKLNPIPCDCSRCFFCERTHSGSTYCRILDNLNPNATSCRFFEQVNFKDRNKSPSKTQKKCKKGFIFMSLKGRFGTPMNSVEHKKKLNPIPCDCSRCFFCERTHSGGTYCRILDNLNPNATSCRFFEQVNSKDREQSPKQK